MKRCPLLIGLLGTTISLTKASGFCNIARVDGKSLNYKVWLEKVSHEPVILTGLTESWKAFDRWTKAEFSRLYGNLTIPRFTSTGTHFTLGPEYGDKIDLSVYVEHSDNQHFIIYDHAETVEIMNAIRADYYLPSILHASSLETILSFGGNPQGANFQRHQVAWLATIHGSKHWYMAPPTANKPPEPVCRTYDGDQRRSEADWAAHGVRYCRVNQGEILWVPTQWWHATCNGAAYTLALGGQQYIPDHLEIVLPNGRLPPVYLASLRGNISRLKGLYEVDKERLVDSICPSRDGVVLPIHLAIKNNHVDTVKWLIDAGGACMKNLALSSRPPVTWAAEFGHIGLLRLFVEEYGHSPSTALKTSIGRGHLNAVQWLVVNGHSQPKEIEALYFLADSMGLERISSYLLEHLKKLGISQRRPKATSLLDRRIEHLKVKFDLADTDSDGTISPEELAAAAPRIPKKLLHVLRWLMREHKVINFEQVKAKILGFMKGRARDEL
ncbi:hypothetical protein AAMO2058_000236800 [Amorphochlora amoebiformis]